MRYTISVLPLLLAVVSMSATAQDVSKPKTEAQCKFSNGKRITVTSSSQPGIVLLE